MARSKQEEQVTQLKGWLEKWELTKGTTQKRLWVLVPYLATMATVFGLGIYANWQNHELLMAQPDLSKLEWWQWILLSLRAILPLVVFTTLVVYFIRWTSAWARQHAEEEFRNRARLLILAVQAGCWKLFETLTMVVVQCRQNCLRIYLVIFSHTVGCLKRMPTYTPTRSAIS
ncbi:MAG: alpha/beta-hydrolase N-terminal domain-containing protein [Planctomycetota bacterium]